MRIRWSVAWIADAVCGLMVIPSVGAQPSAAPSACSLLAREAAEQALGASLGEARVRLDNGTVSSCTFPIKRGGSVSILLRRNAGQAWIAEQVQRMKLGIGQGSFRPVDGLEGQAFLLDMRDSGAALCVFRPDYYLQVSVFKAGAAINVFPVAVKLAKAALTRLEPAPAGPPAPPTRYARLR